MISPILLSKSVKSFFFCSDSEIAAAIREPIETPTTREAQNLFYRSKIEMIWSFSTILIYQLTAAKEFGTP